MSAERNRVVSLVPSFTEAIALQRPEALIGATDWCTYPADLQVRRVRGTKNPNIRAIIDLAPDLVIANMEENRELDVRRLRSAGIEVWVSRIESVSQGLAACGELFDEVLRWARPDWLREASELWSGPRPTPVARVVVPIWRDPWMVIGSRTYTSDLLAKLGWHNMYADHPDRYPAIDLAALDAARADVVLLPDEPFMFSPSDGPEAFTHTATRLVSGRLLTWYGPAMVEAWHTFSTMIASP
ncbi:MAG: helical backbone metal receptor [Nostocoides sp.]